MDRPETNNMADGRGSTDRLQVLVGCGFRATQSRTFVTTVPPPRADAASGRLADGDRIAALSGGFAARRSAHNGGRIALLATF
jgi:hypothetical protein